MQFSHDRNWMRSVPKRGSVGSASNINIFLECELHVHPTLPRFGTDLVQPMVAIHTCTTTELVGQTNLLDEVLKTLIFAQRIQAGVGFQTNQLNITLIICLVEPFKCGVVIA